ncbi:hypothetical protein NECAME_06567 [Necator americanus]|uniref:Uncharacterized protein n=1 Tax=Necator americanus TaxID=51031 RepID=W2TVK9_NECAM|nr:hypothetical protein NECAME_06567 [Necator americanus]ETN85101.1 hypothetical protein NECAME_06567 [Necator americanus]
MHDSDCRAKVRVGPPLNSYLLKAGHPWTLGKKNSGVDDPHNLLDATASAGWKLNSDCEEWRRLAY